MYENSGKHGKNTLALNNGKQCKGLFKQKVCFKLLHLMVTWNMLRTHKVKSVLSIKSNFLQRSNNTDCS